MSVHTLVHDIVSHFSGVNGGVDFSRFLALGPFVNDVRASIETEFREVLPGISSPQRNFEILNFNIQVIIQEDTTSIFHKIREPKSTFHVDHLARNHFFMITFVKFYKTFNTLFATVPQVMFPFL